MITLADLSPVKVFFVSGSESALGPMYTSSHGCVEQATGARGSKYFV
jgi:hypothetical protein